MSARHTILVSLVTGLAGMACAPVLIGPHRAVHPSLSTRRTEVGIAPGALHMWTSDSGPAATMIPYGEGWLRTGIGPGQLQLHLAPTGLGVGYRYDFTAPGGRLSVGLQPEFAAGFQRYDVPLQSDDVPPQGDEFDVSLLKLTPSLTLPLMVRVGPGSLYVAPVLAYTRCQGFYSSTVDEPTQDGDDGTSFNMLTAGGATGYTLDVRSVTLSFEVVVQWSRPFDKPSDLSNKGNVWAVAPTLAVSLHGEE
jgi:hypothetical protein